MTHLIYTTTTKREKHNPVNANRFSPSSSGKVRMYGKCHEKQSYSQKPEKVHSKHLPKKNWLHLWPEHQNYYKWQFPLDYSYFSLTKPLQNPDNKLILKWKFSFKYSTILYTKYTSTSRPQIYLVGPIKNSTIFSCYIRTCKIERLTHSV